MSTKTPGHWWMNQAMKPQAEFQAQGTGLSQCDLILSRLRQARGGEVAMPELAKAGAGGSGFCMVHSRIADLRKRGHDIPPARTHKVDGKMHSFYRLNEVCQPKELLC